MTLASNQGVSLITIGNPKRMVPPDGGCSLQGAEFNLSENRVFDFWIRVRGRHSVAFNVAFGSGRIGYPSYQGYDDHVINIVGNQVGMTSLGDLGLSDDGNWHHVIFDLGYAIEAQLDIRPEKIEKALLSILDRQGSLDLFAGAPAQPIPTTIEVRDMVLRPRLPEEQCYNDISFSVASSALGTADNGRGRYLVGGSVVARQALNGVRVVVVGPKGSTATEELGSVQGHKDFAFVLATLPHESEGQAKLVSADGKVLAGKKLQLPPELTYLSNATINIIPNSHNDIAWLDTPEATANWRRDKVIGPAISLLEKYPDYRYGMETNLFLMEYLDRVPNQAEVIHRLIREGRLAFGAMYNQPYQSLWRDESLVRELYYGRKWMREHLGSDVDCVTAWGTDPPTVALQMPQILAKSGVKYLMLGRFRPGLFDWFSPDGSKVTVGSLGVYRQLSAYFVPYNAVDVALQLPSLLRNWDDFYKKNDIPAEFPVTDMADYQPPTRELIPLAAGWNSNIQQKYGASLNLKFATGEEFMKAVTRDPRTRFPEIRGEWPSVWAYIHGPTHHDVVSAGREAVWDLTAAEKFWSLRNLASHGQERYPTETFDQAWMAQIYPDHGFGGLNGDITDTVFLAKEKEAQLLGRTLLSSSVEWIANHATPLDSQNPKLVVLNPLSWDRTGPVWVEIPTPPDREAVVTNARGEEVTRQRVPQAQGGTTRYILEAANIPAIGYATFTVRLKPRSSDTFRPEEFKNKVYENEFYRLEFAPGGLRSIFDKPLGKELLNPQEFLGGEVLMLDSVGWDAHEEGDFQHPSWKEIEKTSQYAPTWRVIESGPVRSGWRLEQPFRQATVRVEVYAYQKFKRLDFDVQILHWSGEKNKEFRMAFPANIPNGQVTYEVPYGALEVGKDEIEGIPFQGWYSRPAREIHPREVQDWISASNGTFGVMLSSSVAVWDYLDSDEKKDRWTLLQPILLAARRSVHGLGNWYLQKGDHDYHFSFTSFAGDWRNSFRFGNEVNSPFPSAVVLPSALTPAIPSSLSLCHVLQPEYIVSGIKVADDQNGIIVRGYEISGHDIDVAMKFPLQIDHANATSLIEENLSAPVATSAGEVQFKTGQRSIKALRIVGRWNP
jgi:alpha-mannosidase